MSTFDRPVCDFCAPMGFPMNTIHWSAREKEQDRIDNPSEMTLTRYGYIECRTYSYEVRGMVDALQHEFTYRCEDCNRVYEQRIIVPLNPSENEVFI